MKKMHVNVHVFDKRLLQKKSQFTNSLEYQEVSLKKNQISFLYKSQGF